MSNKRSKAELSPVRQSRLRKQASATFLLTLLLAFAYFSLAYIQPHREQSELQRVTGEVQNIRIRNNHRTLHRPAVTRLLVNDTWYEVHGRYEFDHLRHHSEQVRLLVDGINLWVLQSRQGTLISYDISARQYQRQRRIEYAVLTFVAIIFFALVAYQISILRKGGNPFLPKKNLL